MIPSRGWFPTTLQERAAWMQNFIEQLTPIAASVGISVAELAVLTSDNEDFQSIAATTVELDAFGSAVRAYRISLTEGAVGDPHPSFPVSSFTDTPNNQPAGVFQRLVEAVERIRAAAAYTSETGELLGIVPSKAASLIETELKPAISIVAAEVGYKFTANVTRLGQPAYKVFVQRMNSSAWTEAGFTTSNPIEITIAPTNPGEPERILVRAHLVKGSDTIGVPSDPTYVTVNP